jgi:hypothetical protein
MYVPPKRRLPFNGLHCVRVGSKLIMWLISTEELVQRSESIRWWETWSHTEISNSPFSWSNLHYLGSKEAVTIQELKCLVPSPVIFVVNKLFVVNLSCLESLEYGLRNSSRWSRDISYPQKLALTSLTSGGRSVGIVRSQNKATEFSFF